jgi:Rrf2 family protein
VASFLKISEAASLAMHTSVLMAASPGKPLSASQMAARLRVSEAHLSKVLQQLARTGVVRSIRGPKGGFTLTKSGSDTPLLEAYESIEGPVTPPRCLLTTPVSDGRNCILGGILKKVHSEVMEYFGHAKLSELTRFAEREPGAGPLDYSV